MPRMPTNSGEPMEELTPLDPSVAPPYNLIAERLFRARTVIISGEITQRVAAGVMAQLLALAGESSEEITVFINSQGGHVEAGDDSRPGALPEPAGADGGHGVGGEHRGADLRRGAARGPLLPP